MGGFHEEALRLQKEAEWRYGTMFGGHIHTAFGCRGLAPRLGAVLRFPVWRGGEEGGGTGLNVWTVGLVCVLNCPTTKPAAPCATGVCARSFKETHVREKTLPRQHSGSDSKKD